ncbi:MAG: CHAD domain-containing protein [Planctomycetaceae bacterium]
MAKPVKWMEGVAQEAAVRKGASKILAARLKRVIAALPMAATQREDIEHVHRLRVATRRTMTALKLFRKVLPARALKGLRKTLKRIQKVAGEARDLDVLMLGLTKSRHAGKQGMALALLKERKGVQRELKELYWDLRKGKSLKKQADKLIKQVRNCKQGKAKQAFGPWGQKQLREVSQRFFEAAPQDTGDLKQLHRFRIRGKELRYTLELVAGGGPAALRTKVYPAMEQLQEKLGAIHDSLVAMKRMERLSEDEKRSSLRPFAVATAKRKSARLKRQVKAFGRWWTPKKAKEMQRLLTSVKRSRPVKKRTSSSE